jgi:hypothetical protein
LKVFASLFSKSDRGSNASRRWSTSAEVEVLRELKSATKGEFAKQGFAKRGTHKWGFPYNK